jgi:hypothetical protein
VAALRHYGTALLGLLVYRRPPDRARVLRKINLIWWPADQCAAFTTRNFFLGALNRLQALTDGWLGGANPRAGRLDARGLPYPFEEYLWAILIELLHQRRLGPRV